MNIADAGYMPGQAPLWSVVLIWYMIRNGTLCDKPTRNKVKLLLCCAINFSLSLLYRGGWNQISAVPYILPKNSHLLDSSYTQTPVIATLINELNL